MSRKSMRDVDARDLSLDEKVGQPLDQIPAVSSIDKTQWKPDEYDLLFPFVNFARMANAVVTEPGPRQGWFAEPLWRHHSYAPFNARVMENYYSLAFFLGYKAPWNIYYRDSGVLSRLGMALRYTFRLMGKDGAIPEIDAVPSSLMCADRMVASGGFGAEALSGVLVAAGDLLPSDLRRELVEHTRRAVTLVLGSKASLDHAAVVTNQYLGALVAGLRLARQSRDRTLQRLVERGTDLLLGDFISPAGYLYEADGADTFGYFLHTTLYRLIALYQVRPDPRILEVLRRSCDWMGRWLLLEPDARTLILSTAHMTRCAVDYRRPSGWTWEGIGPLLRDPLTARGRSARFSGLKPNGADARRVMKLFLVSAAEEKERRRRWVTEQDPVSACRAELAQRGYAPPFSFNRFKAYHPGGNELAEARSLLPCRNPKVRVETLNDPRGHQYVFARRDRYYMGFAFAGHETRLARNGPSFLWTPDAGTLVMSENQSGACWETSGAEGSGETGSMPGLADVREEGDEVGITIRYERWGLKKVYVLRPDSVLVGLYGTGGVRDDKVYVERIPFLLRQGDVVDVGYGRWQVPVGGKLCFYARDIRIERAGRALATVTLRVEEQVWCRAVTDPDGFIRVRMTFPLTPGFYGKYGYQIVITA